MNFISLKVLYKGFLDAVQRRDARTSWVISGLAPSATGAGSLGVTVASGTAVVNGTFVNYVGGSAGTAAANTSGNPRVDAIRIASGAIVPSIVTGTAAAQPVMPAIGSTDLLIGAAFVPDGATDFTATGAYVEDLTSWRAEIVTTRGDLIRGGVNGVPERVALGASGQVLSSDGLDALWAAANYQTVQDEGIDLTQRAKLNFVGDGVTASDDGVGLRTKVEIPPWMPNLIPNSDFSRRTKWMTFMPETFADTGGYQQIDLGTAPTAAANTLTQGAANNEEAYPASGQFWRDKRFSAQFKAVATTGIFSARGHRIDANNYIEARQNGGTLELRKLVGGVATVVASVANALTLNNWYWLELETQGVGRTGGTAIAKVYSSGAAAASKSSATLQQTLSGAITDAAFDAGAQVSITSDQATAAWGGLATGDGGVYVEGWGPESWSPTFGGTKGGQAFGFDEAASAGPIGKQLALRGYIPATSRTLTLSQPNQTIPFLSPSTGFAFSYYVKLSGASGSGLVRMTLAERDNAAVFLVGNTKSDAGETSWTRKTSTFTSNASTTSGEAAFDFNPGSSLTGTFFVQLLQCEQGSAQGSVATAWRNAPEDFTPLVWRLYSNGSANITTTDTTGQAEAEPRDLAINVFLPWDAKIEARVECLWKNDGLNTNYAQLAADGSSMADSGTTVPFAEDLAVAGRWQQFHAALIQGYAAGKKRIAWRWGCSAGTASLFRDLARTPTLTIVATRGK